MTPLPSCRLISALIFLCLTWLVFCLWLDQARWQAWDIGIDTASWGQVLSNGSRGKGWIYTSYPDRPDSTRSRSMLSAHSYWLISLLGLFYRFWPHPLVLFASFHFAHAFGAFLVGILAWKLAKEDNWFAIGAAILFLVYSPHALAQTRYDFSFRHWSFALLPLAGLLSLSPHRFRPIFPLVLLAAAEENLSLIAGFFCFSLAVKWPTHRRWFSVWGMLFCIYTVFAIRFCIPFFMEEGFQLHFSGRYSHLSNGVGAFFSALINSYNARYVFELLAPLGFVALWRPSLWLIVAIPFAMQNLLSLMGDTRLIGHHYTTPLAVTLFLAAITGMSRLQKKSRDLFLSGIIILNLLLSITWYPSIAWLTDGPDARTLELQRSFAPLETLIPAAGTLSAPPSVAARFWHKSGLWYFPQGIDTADLIVVPKFLPGYPSITGEDINRALNSLNKQFDLSRVLENQDIIVFQRQVALKQ